MSDDNYDTSPIRVDEPLVLLKSEWLDDWYVIERAEHDGREWLEPDEGGASLRTTARISDADVEGPRDHMLGLARAILDRGRFSERRCAVHVRGNEVRLWSPRNSARMAHVPYERAEALAREILATLDGAA